MPQTSNIHVSFACISFSSSRQSVRRMRWRASSKTEQITYRVLNERANQVARLLQRRGIWPGQCVGIFVERSLDMMVGLLGIQKSGAAYVPLDPAYPTERLRLTVEDAQLPLLVTQQSSAGVDARAQRQVVCLDSDWPLMAQESTANLETGVSRKTWSTSFLPRDRRAGLRVCRCLIARW